MAIHPLGLAYLVFYFNIRLSVLAVFGGLPALILLIRCRRLPPVVRVVGVAGLTFVAGLVLSLHLLVYLFTQFVALVVFHAVATAESR